MRVVSALTLVLVLVWVIFSGTNRIEAQTLSLCTAPGGESTRSESIRVDGFERNYRIHIPVFEHAHREPIIFGFHGRGETPEQLVRYSNLSRLRAIVIYPRGLPGRGGKLSWSGTPTAARGVDDVRFVRAILARLQASPCVDAARVYATGKSDGGGLAGQLACRAADIITAAAPVAGAYYPINGGCAPTRPVAILEFHGTDDRVVPYRGSRKRKLPEIDAWLAGWANRDGCARERRSRIVAPDVSRHVWSGCRRGGYVEGYRIEGGGHTWPGAHSPSGPGTTTQAIDATTIIAKFFGVSL